MNGLFPFSVAGLANTQLLNWQLKTTLDNSDSIDRWLQRTNGVVMNSAGPTNIHPTPTITRPARIKNRGTCRVGQVVSLDLYSGTQRTPLNSGHPQYYEQFWKSRLSFRSLQYLSKPWIADTPLLRIMDSRTVFTIPTVCKQYLTILI